jgi:serine/threonine protein phosphatase PrpC
MSMSKRMMFDSLLTSIFGEEAHSGNVAVTTKTTDRGEINECGVRSYAFSGMQGWRVTMEDAHLAASSIPVDGHGRLETGHSMFGVMDGHGGDFTSYFAAETFLQVFSKNARLKQYAKLKREEQRDVIGLSLLRSVLRETFIYLDSEIRKKQKMRNELAAEKNKTSSTRQRAERSGSTCVIVMVTPSHFICANAGDSRAILQRNGKVLPLSFDHKPNNIPELQRVNNAGGFVKHRRIDGDLAVSRGLGDFSFKKNNKLSVIQQKVSPDPEFVIYPRNMETDEFLVLACDGIWDVATNSGCGQFIQRIMDEGERNIGVICEEALDICLNRNSRDNMTLGVVTFDGAKFGNSSWRTTSRQAAEVATRAVTGVEAATRAAAGAGYIFASTIGTTPTTVKG